MNTYRIHTYGCQMNERDSENLAGLLDGAGYRKSAPDEEPDIIVFNTCCVRENAERKIFGKINEYKALRTRRKDVILAIVGCLPQQPGASERIMRLLPHVNVILGTHNVHRLMDAIEVASTIERPFVEVWEREADIIEGAPSTRAPGLTAWVTVTYGCNNFCSYCIVPYVRGRERSRRPQDIVSEVRTLVERGYKEVTLLGQNVNAYGKTLCPAVDFADRLSMLNEIEGLYRIRYMTSHPRDYSQKMIDAVKHLDKVCEHFHLPVQSGSNRILTQMNRGYTREYYLDLIHRIRKAVPDSAITTDFIVGFPGEEEADFEDTLDLVRTVRFDAAYMFMYSPRTGTAAAKMPDQVTEAVRKERITRLMQIQDAVTKEINQNTVGRVLEVLVEGPSQRDPRKLSGRTRTDKVVNFTGSGETGTLLDVRITRAGTWTLRGEAI